MYVAFFIYFRNGGFSRESSFRLGKGDEGNGRGNVLKTGRGHSFERGSI
jgi:hypothetical protein